MGAGGPGTNLRERAAPRSEERGPRALTLSPLSCPQAPPCCPAAGAEPQRVGASLWWQGQPPHRAGLRDPSSLRSPDCLALGHLHPSQAQGSQPRQDVSPQVLPGRMEQRPMVGGIREDLQDLVWQLGPEFDPGGRGRGHSPHWARRALSTFHRAAPLWRRVLPVWSRPVPPSWPVPVITWMVVQQSPLLHEPPPWFKRRACRVPDVQGLMTLPGQVNRGDHSGSLECAFIPEM